MRFVLSNLNYWNEVNFMLFVGTFVMLCFERQYS